LWDLRGGFAQDSTPLKKGATQTKGGASAVQEVHAMVS